MTHLTCNTCHDNKSLDKFRTKLDKRDSRTYTVKKCKSCESLEQQARAKTAKGKSYHAQWKEDNFAKNPVRHMIQERIANWRRKSKENGVISDLTTDYLVELWEQQDGLCYYSGDLMIPVGGSRLRRPTPVSASLEKLDPYKWYVKDNVAWVTYRANTSKGNLTEAEYYDYIQTVLSRRDERERKLQQQALPQEKQRLDG